ncbi:MAG: polysulfide reductase [Deltaproteobacteria bacterium RIFCSPHIGHO2_02_FULL_40_11]|nr:MAG: polysulfide reductase [Deltaproteobacteria bacterium RIFCSPHIGHO2_02_FULL_40_11]
MITYIQFWLRMFQTALTGNLKYFFWIGFLATLALVGFLAYLNQFTHGFVVTNLSNHVSWGAYIANFTYLVGVAAAAVLLVFPSYIYHQKELKEVVLIGELLAVSAMLMCSLFILVDLGRPDHFWHILPFLGELNFPTSILAWDVVVLNVYLILNLFIPGYILWRRYIGKAPSGKHYLPFVYLSIVWAISIHTVTAFLYVGLGGRPYWNAAILAPRFLISAFAGGPAILLIIFYFIKKYTDMHISDYVSQYLKTIMTYALTANLFLFGCEIYKEYYTSSLHVASLNYLLFGLHGHKMLVGYIWGAIFMELAALVILFTPRLRNQWKTLSIGCVFVILGIWVEKGMGLLIPGFIPSPLGDIVEYTPSLNEFLICLGIWAFGAMCFTMMAKVAISIETGRLALNNEQR